MHDRSIDCIWIGRLSRVAFISHYTHSPTFCRSRGNDRPWNVRACICIIRLRFISSGSRIRGERLLSTSYLYPSDVIPWNHRGGVFSCVRIDQQGELIVRSLPPFPPLRLLQMRRWKNKYAYYKVKFVYIQSSHLVICFLQSRNFLSPYLFLLKHFSFLQKIHNI